MSSQRIGKYACLEIERRYLLAEIPSGLDVNLGGWLITDRYIPGTRLRLRQMRKPTGNEVIYKFTQKYKSEEQNTTETTITNMYLTEAEYKCLERLEAKYLMKRRFRYKFDGYTFSIDVFDGRHQGLILAEIEFEEEQYSTEMSTPSFAIRDVTDDVFFTGGNLVTMSEKVFRQGLERYLSR